MLPSPLPAVVVVALEQRQEFGAPGVANNDGRDHVISPIR